MAENGFAGMRHGVSPRGSGVRRWARVGLVACLSFPLWTGAATFNQVFQEGVNYQDVNPPVPTRVQGGVEVTEMFWYGCETCYVIRPYMHNWLKTQPKSVHYRRMPAVLNARMDAQARAYFAAQELGVLNQVDAPLFSAIHEQHLALNTEDALSAFFREFGVSKDDFARAFNSPEVAGKMFRARNLGARYGLRGVPAIIVNGRYLTDPTLVKSPEELVMVVNFLVQQELRRLNK